MLRRFAYFLLTVVILVIMTLPIFAFVLAARGELRVGNDQGSYVRIFMVNSDESEGIGLQRERTSTTAEGCLQGSVRYLLWAGQSQELDTDYCVCPHDASGQMMHSGRCEDLP